MTVVDTPASFSSSKSSDDFKRTADAIGAPYSELAIVAVLKVFGECLNDGAVIWRTTNRPLDVLNYRF
ncbi:hypothetical protein BDR22DRAFT_868005 [Usnea florida]